MCVVMTLQYLMEIHAKSAKLNKAEFKQWYSGQLFIAQPELEGHKTVKARLKALSPLKTLGTARFSWIAIAALLSNILGLSTSLFVMVVYDRVLPNQATQSLYALAIGVGLLSCLIRFLRVHAAVLLSVHLWVLILP